MRTFEQIFRREGVKAAFVEGDSFHRYDRAEMKRQMAQSLEASNQRFSHFGPEANLFKELESLFRDYGGNGSGRAREEFRNEGEDAPFGDGTRQINTLGEVPPGAPLSFCHGGEWAGTRGGCE